MPRSARLVIPGYPHHIVHRGNRGEAIFSTPEDRQFYLGWLHQYAVEHALRIWAHCLMTNHVHLVVVPEHADSLGLGIGQAHTRYSRWVSRRVGTPGHLWANRFYSAPLEEPWAAIRYVELNPVRARMVERAQSYRWSSAPAHVRGAPDPLISLNLPLGAPEQGAAWRDWLEEGVDETTLHAIRNSTNRGRPVGSREFVAWVTQRK